MENRKRNIQMKFYVTEEEKRLIDEKMKQLPIKQYGAYFRKMAIDGYILVVDRSDTKAYIEENVLPLWLWRSTASASFFRCLIP